MSTYGYYRLSDETCLYGIIPDDTNKQRIIDNSLVYGTLEAVVEQKYSKPASDESGMSELRYLEIGVESLFSLETRLSRDKFIEAKKEHYRCLKQENDNVVQKINALLGITGMIKSNTTPGKIVKDKLLVYGEYVDIYRFDKISFPNIHEL